MPWHARLHLDYQNEQNRSVARFRHDGPLRILQSLYPEGDAVCHNVLVHPPGGLVGGDTLDIDVKVAGGSHGLITTPGASRFYRSDGELALQRTHLTLAPEARLEWLPLEAICYSGCRAENHITIDAAPGAELIGWDVTALGLPHANRPFDRGTLLQHIEVPGKWLERGRIDAADRRLLQSPIGLAGNRCMASLFFISGSPMPKARRDTLLDIARALSDAHSLCESVGTTSPQPQVIVLRVLAPVVEPAMQLLRQVWLAWRAEVWALRAAAPRIWAM
ncbi:MULTISPECIES: urease accessory protein UreD [unclassified Variovorax]|jgi:urease accessory protein|uniref:urease accessory protein UreD n=1 Tax=unclassified Variovorax TaxID=663243 RepID=UPI002B227EAD|nr:MULTISPECIES: urease accessory protein UreD [unclassified Variovorax]MEB0056025.1 urease accessory protein UreD [Variovorax sp. LG9.2]MEB0111162.1 urease accessory protein UreD [Variovorax sp. RTB1]